MMRSPSFICVSSSSGSSQQNRALGIVASLRWIYPSIVINLGGCGRAVAVDAQQGPDFDWCDGGSSFLGRGMPPHRAPLILDSRFMDSERGVASRLRNCAPFAC